MCNVLLGVTGSVAAIKTPELVAALTAGGFTVRVVATTPALYFFDGAPLGKTLTTDADEWPGEQYRRGDPVAHIELRKWADLLVIAPLDANTLAKLAVGISDNCLTCVWRAWDPVKPVVLAPAMNTLMWQHPFTRRHLRSIACDFGGGHLPSHLDEDALIPLMNDRCKGLRVVPPVSKLLACGDVGVGAMAAVEEIVTTIGIDLDRVPDSPGPDSHSR
jgi:phosphopantothenoylcysteine decarboxylase